MSAASQPDLDALLSSVAPELRAMPGIVDAVLDYPYRSTLSRKQPLDIRLVWGLRDDTAFPVTSTDLAEMVAIVRRGHGVLIVASRRDLREKAKALLSTVLDGTTPPPFGPRCFQVVPGGRK